MNDQSLLTRAAAFRDPAYPSTEELDEGQRTLIADFNRRLDSGKIDLEKPPCLLCGGQSFDLLSAYDRYRIRQPVVICRGCGLIQLRPRMTDASLGWFYGSDHYRAIYNPEFLELTEERFLARLPKARTAFLEQALAGRTVDSVLEVGCAAGQNLYSFFKQGKRVVGYDLGPQALAFGRSLGMDLRSGSYPDIADGPYDLIVLSHVMEHFNDPVAAVGAIARHLAPEGRFYIEVPDSDEFCLGALQNAHVYYFTEPTLRRALALAGLEATAVNRCKPHLGVLCKRAEAAAGPDLGDEYRRVVRLIRRHDRRQRIKEALNRVGLLGAARKLLRRA